MLRHPNVLLLLLFTFLPVPAVAEKLCIWEFKSGGVEIILLGSIHSLTQEMYPLPAAIDRVYSRAEKLVFEVDLTQLNARDISLIMERRGLFQDGKTLEQNLQPETLSLLQGYLREHNIGMTRVYRMKPWYLTLTIGQQELQRLGYQPNLGIDQVLQQRALKDGKTILQLESFQEQIDFLSGDSPAIQDLALRASLEDRSSIAEDIQMLLDAWSVGDADKMLELSLNAPSRYSELQTQMNSLIDFRNTKMIERIREYAEEGLGTYLVVIGALHMGGENGIIRKLSEDYEITQLSN